MKKINSDLKSKQAIYLKALLFVFIWILSIILNLTSEELSYKIVSISLVGHQLGFTILCFML